MDEYESILNATIANKKQELNDNKGKLSDTKKDLLSLLIAANAEEESDTQLTLEELRVRVLLIKLTLISTRTT